jgi:hypothetical protein
MQTLEELVHELGVAYRAGAGLIDRLDHIELRTNQPRDLDEGGSSGKPGSRPPAPLAHLHWVQIMKHELVWTDRILRESLHSQPWRRALAAIPHNAEAAGKWASTRHDIAVLHSTARTVLGFQDPSRPMRHVRCLVCDQATIYARPDLDEPRAWCTNHECVDEETGRPARYARERIYLLTRNMVA